VVSFANTALEHRGLLHCAQGIGLLLLQLQEPPPRMSEREREETWNTKGESTDALRLSLKGTSSPMLVVEELGPAP